MNYRFSILEKIINRTRNNVKNIGRFVRFSIKSGESSSNRFAKMVYIDIPEPKLERYYYLLAKYFELAGWLVRIRFSPWLLLNLRNYSFLIYNIKYLRIVTSPPDGPDLELSLKPTEPEKKRVTVDFNYFKKEKEAGSYIFPYSMHPDVYDRGISERLDEFRSVRKQIGIFFGGNWTEEYANPDIKQIFGKINRPTIVAMFEQIIDGTDRISVTNDVQLANVLKAPKIPLLWLKRDVRIEIDEWTRMLARSDFFICPPGVSMPLSHNAIEAMAVGAIPILQYSELFDPPLKHMVNCIVFENEDDLIEKIRFCLNLPITQVRELRSGVIDYYDDFLDPVKAIGRLYNNLSSLTKIYVNAEHFSMAVYRKEINHDPKPHS